MLRRGGLLRRPRSSRSLLARRLPSLLLFLLPLLALAAYLRDWVFEGIVRVGANGRLKELRFAPVDARLSSCPLHPGVADSAFAYVTALGTPSYLPGVRALAQALRAGGARYPLLVLVPEDVDYDVDTPLQADQAQSAEARDGFEVRVSRVPRLRYAPGWTTAGCRYWWLNAAGHYAELEHSLTKLWAFNLSAQFSTVLYLDADTLPLGGAPDELFALAAARRGGREGPPLFAAAPDWGRHGGDAPGFNAGVFLVTPCDGLTERLLALAASPGHAHAARCHRRGTADQPLLQYYFGLNTVGLSVRYNMLQPSLAARPRLAADYPPRLVHFTKTKPWELYGPHGMSSKDDGFEEWAEACDAVECCAPPAECGQLSAARFPRGPHFDALAI